MGSFDDLYGDYFDFDGDGETSLDEEIIGYNIINDCINEAQADESDEDDLDNEDWELLCDEGAEYGLDPEEFDTADDFIEAVEEMRGDAVYIPRVKVPVSSASAAYTEPKKSDYPNKRKFEAAQHLHDIQTDTLGLYTGEEKRLQQEKCEFILHSDVLAAQYLTLWDGFLFVQAAKEHFALPIEVPDEDAEPITLFVEFLIDVAEQDAKLAVDIWAWCIRKFGPYQEYMESEITLYNEIAISLVEFTPKFLNEAVNRCGTDPHFRKGLFRDSPDEMTWGAAQFIITALELDLISVAQSIFTDALANPKVNGRCMESLIDLILRGCEDADGPKAMERFREHILPMVRALQDTRIQRLLPTFIERMNSHLEMYAACEDEWRYHFPQAQVYGLDPNDFESEFELCKAIEEKQNEKRREAELQRQAELEKQRIEKEIAKADKTVYTFCGVCFDGQDQVYHYLTDGIDVKIGDQIIVPVGINNQEKIVEVVTVEQHLRRTAPYPVDKAKKIIGKAPIETAE